MPEKPQNSETIRLEIRQLSSDDWEKFRNLRKTMLVVDPLAFGHSNFDFETETFWRDLLDKQSTYVAFDSERVVATASLTFDAEHNEWIITGVWTDPKYRGLGMMKQLLKNCIDSARGQGAQSIGIAVHEELKAAIRLYESFGFVREEEKDYSLGRAPGRFLAYRLDLSG